MSKVKVFSGKVVDYMFHIMNQENVGRIRHVFQCHKAVKLQTLESNFN